MDITLKSKQVSEAIEFYLAFKGYTATDIHYAIYNGDLHARVENVKRQGFNEDKLFKAIKEDDLF